MTCGSATACMDANSCNGYWTTRVEVVLYERVATIFFLTILNDFNNFLHGRSWGGMRMSSGVNRVVITFPPQSLKDFHVAPAAWFSNERTITRFASCPYSWFLVHCIHQLGYRIRGQILLSGFTNISKNKLYVYTIFKARNSYSWIKYVIQILPS